MTRLYLIRHCEAEGNLYRRAHGWYDGRITPKGARQLDALAERFRAERFDALYSSDLGRAAATAGALRRGRNLTLMTDMRLREQRLGVWEDRPWGNLEYETPEKMYVFNNDPARWSVRGGESYPALQERLLGCIWEIAARHEGKTVACAGHGMAIRALLAAALGIPSAEINDVGHGDNTAVSLLEIEGERIRVVFRNDASHLGEELSTFSRQSWWREGRSDANNVRFVRLDPRHDGRRYLDYYEKSWQAVHGSLEGFVPEPYLYHARLHARANPDALVSIVRPDGSAVGITELDTERGRSRGLGHICLCFVEAPFRRSLLGVQLIGHAVSLFRGLGRKAVRLNVHESNAGAIRFYESCEFRAVGEREAASGGKLLVMEKAL